MVSALKDHRGEKAKYARLGTCDWKGILMIIDSTCVVPSGTVSARIPRIKTSTDHTREEGAAQTQEDAG
jgi:hypothetical protein